MEKESLNWIVMRKLLACLLPWMVVTATVASAPSTATVAYTYNGASVQEALKEGDNCWVTVEGVRAWGWKLTRVGSEFDVEAEGRNLRLQSKVLNNRTYLLASAAVNQLGAIGTWVQSEYKILGQIRGIEMSGSSIRVDSTLSFTTNIFTLSEPSNRLVVDIQGSALAKDHKFDLPANVRINQWKPDIVRIVIVDPAVQKPKTTRPASTRWLNLSLDPYQFPSGEIEEPPFIDDTPETSTTDKVPVAPTPKPNPEIVVANIQGAIVTQAKERSELLQISLDKALRPQPVVSYDDVNTVVLRMPAKMVTENPFSNVRGKFIQKVEAKILPNNMLEVRISTSRPMVYSLSAGGTSVMLRLTQPKNSGGGIAGKTIVVDPGHGGKDSGAHFKSSGTMEKVYALAVSRIIADELTDQGANVIMTRNSDVFIPLKERSAIANRNNADLFISVHFNSSSVNDKVTGNMTFYHMRQPEGMLLAKCIQDEIAEVSELKSFGTWSDSRIAKTSGFSVLRETTMPAVLLELGFINHATDRSKMVREDWQRKVGAAVVKGIKVYLSDVKEEKQP